MRRLASTTTEAGRDTTRPVRAFVICFLILAASTVLGASLGMGGALLAFAIAQGDGRGGLFVVAGFLVMLGAALGLVAGAVCTAWWLHGRTFAIRNAKTSRRD